MKAVSSYRELLVWQMALGAAVQVYEKSRNFPPEEKFRITTQMRRAAAAIPANIAEGQARRTTEEFLLQLGVARAALAEVETVLVLSQKLGYLNSQELHALSASYEEINKLLNGLMKSLSSQTAPAGIERGNGNLIPHP